MIYSFYFFYLFISFVFSLSPFWPQPKQYEITTTTTTTTKLILDQNFQFIFSKDSEFLNKISKRYLNLILPLTNGNLKECYVNINTINENEEITLQLNVNESYSLVINNNNECNIQTENVWGVLNAFETFTQLLLRNTKDGEVYTTYAPLNIVDEPRFSHRGLLIDTSRHYLPVNEIQRIIDSLSMNKFNVLHWHMVDAQSFPVDTPSAPRMINGAYSSSHVYTLTDIEMLTNYAAERGVRILPEIDIPGHAASWTDGYPSIMAKCFKKYSYNINDYALDPTQDDTYDIVEKVLKDIIQTMGVQQFHLGGDEVVYGCWANDTNILEFMEKQGMTSYNQLLEYFVLKVDDITRSYGSTPIHWEEVFKAGAKVGSDVIFEVWTVQDNIKMVVDSQFRVIAAPSDVWYLDHSDNTWSKMYAYDPTTNLTSTEASYIIGGEVAMWGEHVDENNIESIVYPRASSVGERLWSPSNVVDQEDALNRLINHRCRMINRGFKPSAIQPGFCSLTTVPV